jgi:hypothetical protein
MLNMLINIYKIYIYRAPVMFIIIIIIIIIIFIIIINLPGLGSWLYRLVADTT